MYLTIEHNSGVSVFGPDCGPDQVQGGWQWASFSRGSGSRSVRALARDLKLNPTTVARIYRQLEAEEIICTQAGRGTFIAQGRSSLTAAEKRRQIAGKVRELVVEAGRIDLDYSELKKLLDSEIDRIERKESH